MLPESHHWLAVDAAPHIPGRWYYVGNICVAHVGQGPQGWSALVDRHLGPDAWRSAPAPYRETAMRWVEAWALRERLRLADEASRMRIGKAGWPMFIEPAED